MKTATNCHAIRETRAAICEILRGLSSPASLECLSHLERGDDASAIEISVDPSGYSDWREFFLDYSAVELFSKLDCLNLPIDREAVAIEKFLHCEGLCRQANIRFASPYSDPFLESDVSEVFHLARKKIGAVLGNFSWDSVGPLMAFGPGASIGLTRRHRHPVYKFGFEKPTVTGECAAFAERLIRSSPQWSKTVPLLGGKPGSDLSIVPGSRITTVPKSAKTDRVIAIEPLMNMFIQKGIGGRIRRLLRRVGIDLDSQGPNQVAARKGSLDGSLATIDLSSASDTISRGLVEWLLPEDWVFAMKVCRTKSSVLPSGESIFLQKFSSMGNGFTFELESLIFWGLSSACAILVGGSSREVLVYGDDIVVPVSCSGLLLRVLSFAGFTPNWKKSYCEGPFRESCGKHYFRGRDVTPFYVKKHVGTDERKLWLANSIKRLAYRLVGYDYGLYGQLKPAYDLVVRSISRQYSRLSIPDGFGDGGLVKDFDEVRPRTPRGKNRGYCGYEYIHMSRVFMKRVPCEQPALTTALFELMARYRNAVIHDLDLREWARTVRESIPLEVSLERYRYKIVKSVAPRWVSLGPWLIGF